jgi:hypothetical protein
MPDLTGIFENKKLLQQQEKYHENKHFHKIPSDRAAIHQQRVQYVNDNSATIYRSGFGRGSMVKW